MSRLHFYLVIASAIGLASLGHFPLEPYIELTPIDTTPPLEKAREHAAKVRPSIDAALALKPAQDVRGAGEVARLSLGSSLPEYAANPAGDPARFESFHLAAHRIVSLDGTWHQRPATTSRDLNLIADAIFRSLRKFEASARRPLQARDAATVQQFRAAALLARYHALRIPAAMHYNLFLREGHPAELIAATQREKDAIAVWVELAGLRSTPATVGDWHAETRRLKSGLEELERQCRPDEAAASRYQVWEPAADIPYSFFPPETPES